MSVVVGHPSGTANNKVLVSGLARAGLLSAFFTTMAVPAALAECSLLPRQLRSALRRRLFPGVPWRKIHAAFGRETIRLLGRRWGSRRLFAHEIGWASMDAVNRALARRMGDYVRRHEGSVRLVYGYEDAALAAFHVARGLGITCCYELPVAAWRTMRQIMSEERELSPGWATTLRSLHDSPAKLTHKDEELSLAHHIVVASSFARDSVREQYPLSTDIHVIPYGAPPVARVAPAHRHPAEPLRVVYVGALNQQKGLAYLCDAMRRLGSSCSLTLIGRAPAPVCPALDEALDGHDWTGPLPHDEALRRMAAHHVMVFPSLCEGFGLVILEAMAQGVPVITTTNTGGPDVIEDGVDGFIVPIRDAAAIAARLERLHQDEDYRTAMAHAARRKAAAFGWQRYERETSDLLRSLVS